MGRMGCTCSTTGTARTTGTAVQPWTVHLVLLVQLYSLAVLRYQYLATAVALGVGRMQQSRNAVSAVHLHAWLCPRILLVGS